MNLILKDYLLVKNKIRNYGILCMLILVLLKMSIHYPVIENILVCVVGIIFAYFNTIISFEVERNTEGAMMLILPYVRKNIVTAKYVGIIFRTVIFYILTSLILLGMNWINISEWYGKGLLYGLALSLLTHAFMLPFFIRFEYTKAANLFMIVFMIIGVTIPIVPKNNMYTKQLFIQLNQIHYMGIFLSSLIGLLLSYYISCIIYEKKEFS